MGYESRDREREKARESEGCVQWRGEDRRVEGSHPPPGPAHPAIPTTRC